MEGSMTTLHQRRLTTESLLELVASAPESATLTDDHRRSLSARFRAVAGTDHRRLDAWSVERAGRLSTGFRWSPATARRIIGNGGVRGLRRTPVASLLDAVHDEVDDQL